MPSFKSIRKRIYDIIDATNEEDNLSRGYDIFMIIVIAISMIPLMTKAPKCPTMAVSTYCKMEESICCTMAGIASRTNALSVSRLRTKDILVLFLIFSDTCFAQKLSS